MKITLYGLLYFCLISLLTAQTTLVERHGITWELEGNVTTGTFVNGDPWVVGPVQLLNITPETTVDGNGATLHGSMLNPSMGTDQGYDSRIIYHNYYPNLNIENSLPLQLNPDSVVVSSISILGTVARHNPQTYVLAVLTVLNEPPPANSFRPPVHGNDRVPRWTTNTFDLTGFNSFSSVPGSPSAAMLSEMIQELEYYWNEQNTTWTAREIHPEVQPTYGRDISRAYGEAMLALHLDYPEEVKTELLVHLVQRGLDIYGAANAGGVWQNNGGHNLGRKMPLLLTATMLADNTILEYGSAATHFIFQEDQQTFYVTADNVPPYSQEDIGMADWAAKYATTRNVDPSWDSAYRILNGGPTLAHVLMARLMGLENAWNWPALFDYMDRFWSIEKDSRRGGTNSISELAWQLWDLTMATDEIPPSISGVTVSNVGSSNALVTWVTNENATSILDYGTTTAYGQIASTAGSTKSHSVQITGLQSDTSYNFRVRSADMAGNESVSGDFTFTTILPDVTAPTCDLISPANGDTILDQVLLTASASDNVGGSGVASVEFLLNNNVIGIGSQQVNSTTYTLSWGTNIVSNGNYILQARATDGDGNVTSSPSINVIVNNPPPDLSDGLVGYWKFDEGSGTIAGDSSGNGWDATVSENWTTGIINNALAFNEANPDEARLGNFNVEGNQLTLSAWVNPAAIGTDPRILAKATGTSEGDIYWMLEIDDGGVDQLGFRLNSGGSYFRLTGGAVEPGQWTHVVGVYDGITMRIYQDGVEVASEAKSGSIRIGDADVWVGDNPPSGGRDFDGIIDEVRIYNRALSPEEIALLLEIDFTTDTTAPILSDTSATSISSDSAVITWVTNENSTSIVDYGTTTTYGQIASTAGSTTSHSVQITGLQSNTDYYYRLRSTDLAGNESVSGDFIFTTNVDNVTSGNVYIRDGASGDGSDWTNALDDLPASLDRGKVYWIADGNYNSYNFDDPISGETYITIRKANDSNHGTESGWLASYGDGVAAFGSIVFSSNYVNIDGTSEYGIKIIGDYQGASAQVDSDYINISYVELDGNFTTDSTGNHIDGSCIGIYINGSNVLVENCDIHNIADDAVGVYGSNIRIIGNRIHDLHGCGTDGGCGPCFNGHSDGLELIGASNVEIKNNLVYDIRSNGAFFTGQSSYIENLILENNIFYSPDTGFCIYLLYINGAKVFNNVFWGRTQGDKYGGLAIGPGLTDLQMYNNIILNINYSHLGGAFDASEHDINYNHFGMINTSEYTEKSNDIVGDPLFASIPMSANLADHPKDITVDDFRLQDGSASINSGYSGDSIIVIPGLDILGNDRFGDAGPDRGVVEFAGSSADLTPPLLSVIAVSNISSDSAVITWVTNENATSIVDYSINATYDPFVSTDIVGSTTSHSVQITGLQSDTDYYFRVRSTDLAGNESVSGDFTFRTMVPDVTAPTCDLILPADGDTILSQVLLTASASDNIGGSGVASVEFLLNDSVIGIGSQVDSTTYTLLWNTSTVSNGNYTLQARATDLDGNITSSSSITVIVDNPPLDLNSGLIGYWKFDEGSGTIAGDSSGNGRDAIVSENWTTSIINNALAFNEASLDEARLGDFNVEGDQLTLAAWIKPSMIGTDPRILAKASGTSTSDIYWMLEIDDGGIDRLGFRLSNTWGTYTRLTGGTVELNQWTHVVGVYDGITMRLYQDGVEVASEAKTGSLKVGAGVDIWVGDNPPVSGVRGFDGLVDEVRIYSRALSPSEVVALLEAVPPTAPQGLQIISTP